MQMSSTEYGSHRNITIRIKENLCQEDAQTDKSEDGMSVEVRREIESSLTNSSSIKGLWGENAKYKLENTTSDSEQTVDACLSDWECENDFLETKNSSKRETKRELKCPSAESVEQSQKSIEGVCSASDFTVKMASRSDSEGILCSQVAHTTRCSGVTEHLSNSSSSESDDTCLDNTSVCAENNTTLIDNSDLNLPTSLSSEDLATHCTVPHDMKPVPYYMVKPTTFPDQGKVTTLEDRHDNLIESRISNIDMVTRLGTITGFQESQNGKPVKFQLDSVQNLSNHAVALHVDLRVYIRVKDKLSPPDVYVLTDSIRPTDIARNRKDTVYNTWCPAIIVSVKDNYIFVKPLCKISDEIAPATNVFVSQRLFPSYLPRTIHGDEVIFALGPRNVKSPKAINVQVSKYNRRDFGTLMNYLYSVRYKHSDRVSLNGIITNNTLWRYLSRIRMKDHRLQLWLVLRIISCVNYIVGTRYSSSAACRQLIKELIKSKTLDPLSIILPLTNTNVMSLILDGTSVEGTIQRFITMASKYVKEYTNRLMPLIDIIITKQTTGSHVTKWVYDMLRDFTINCAEDRVLESHWTETPLIIAPLEFGATSIHDRGLNPVRIGEPYTSAEEYMDTYFRLLRADCFHSLGLGVSNLLNGARTTTEMTIYHSIHIAGYQFECGRIILALKFIPLLPIRDWKLKSNFIYGNLICLSPTGNFTDAIWATVAFRDLDLLEEKQIIILTLCTEFNDLTDISVMVKLWSHSGTTVMIESPTYFHAFRPILVALQNIDLTHLPFCDQLVHLKVNSSKPDKSSPYIKDALFDIRCILRDVRRCDEHRARNLKEIQVFIKENKNSILDESQIKALIHCLTYPLAIIQGPPGTGKTWIGVKLAHILLSVIPKLTTPILVLTYKNHALDEFLKHLLKDLDPTAVVRVGGRSTDKDLNKCNLREQAVKQKLKEYYTERKDIQNKMASIKKKIASCVTELHKRTWFVTYRKIIEALSESQLRKFITNANYSKRPSHQRDLVYYGRDTGESTSKSSAANQLNYICDNHGSLKKFVSMGHVWPPNSIELTFWKLLLHLLRVWIPSDEKLSLMKELQAEYLQTGSDHQEENEDDTGLNLLQIDELQIETIHNERLAKEKQTDFQKINSDIIWFPERSRDTPYCRLSDLPHNIKTNSGIINAINLWQLNDTQRVQFVLSHLTSTSSELIKEVDELCLSLSLLQIRNDAINTEESIVALRKAKVVGMTITGASIYHDLVVGMSSQVVIVEEAAEILEPSLIAALTPSVQHLILIGDHMQLRPTVETYELQKLYNFNVSAMERLIASGYPYVALTRQSRMRPEISALLKDIYPSLEDNLNIVDTQETSSYIRDSVFFWSHGAPEEKNQRGYVNICEVERVRALAWYLQSTGINVKHITVLTPYQAQVMAIRTALRMCDNTELASLCVSSIDQYQGDENEFVILSLIRSNNSGRIGFLGEINRRCVAQSRAKRGLYIIGNMDTFKTSKTWTHLTDSLCFDECVGEKMIIRCPQHSDPVNYVSSAEQLEIVAKDHGKLCSKLCGKKLPCDYTDHVCRKMCLPLHSHLSCYEITENKCSQCGFICKITCEAIKSGRRCTQSLWYSHPECGHDISIFCNLLSQYLDRKNAFPIRCTKTVTCISARCGHTKIKRCFEDEALLDCDKPCDLRMECGVHECAKVCGLHDHSGCTTEVNVTLSCGHRITKQCSGREQCTFPCEKIRDCGHPCTFICGEDCQRGSCSFCNEEYSMQHESARKAARNRIKKLKKHISRGNGKQFSQQIIHADGKNAAEYLKVEDIVLKYIGAVDNSYAVVVSVEKVRNLYLEQAHEEAKLEAHSLCCDNKIYETSSEAIENIIQYGFDLYNGMFGDGVYFSACTSNATTQLQGSQQSVLLVCRVLIGYSLELQRRSESHNIDTLRNSGHDSVLGTQDIDSAKQINFVIFDKRQALPEYVVTYRKHKIVSIADLNRLPAQKGNEVVRTKISPSRSVDMGNPFEMRYRVAEGHFYRMLAKTGCRDTPHQIKCIEIVQNDTLEERFNAKRREFQKLGIPDSIVLCYHGTNPGSVDQILQQSLQMRCAKRQVFGDGNYMSEFPITSMQYGKALILCETLPGVQVKYNQTSASETVNSVLVRPDDGDYSEMVIIKDSDQIMPRYVIYL